MNTKMTIEEVRKLMAVHYGVSPIAPLCALAISQHEELERLLGEHTDANEKNFALNDEILRVKTQLAERAAMVAEYMNELKNVEAYLPHSHPLALRAETLLASITASAKHNAEILKTAEEHYYRHDGYACEICQAVRDKVGPLT